MNFKSLLASLLLLPSLSYGTCMSTCTDTDGGLFPEQGGAGIIITQCAAPGGPVHRSEERVMDECSENVVTEVICHGMPGAEWVKQVKFECLKCSPILKGVCLEVGSIIE